MIEFGFPLVMVGFEEGDWVYVGVLWIWERLVVCNCVVGVKELLVVVEV